MGPDIHAGRQDDAFLDDRPDPGVDIHAVQQRQHDRSVAQTRLQPGQHSGQVEFFDADQAKIQPRQVPDIVGRERRRADLIAILLRAQPQPGLLDRAQMLTASDERDGDTASIPEQTAQLPSEIAPDAPDPDDPDVLDGHRDGRVRASVGSRRGFKADGHWTA